MEKRTLLGVLSCVLVLLLIGAVGVAQESAVKGNLGGVVVDSSGAVVPDANVTLTGPMGTLAARTDGQGNFQFFRLVPGTYGVKVEKAGFRTEEAKGIEVAIGRTATLRLQLEPGPVSEVIEVTGTAMTVDTSSTGTGSNLSDSFYSSVPIPRNVAGLFYVTPGAADSGGAGRANPSVSGGSGLENLYVADGVNITDPAFGGLGIFTRQYGSVGTGINLSFIKEVQVKTGGFEPQYGQSTGGVVQIVTKSGSEHFHGALGAFYAPVETAATPKNIDVFRNSKFGTDAFVANANPVGSRTPSGLYAGPGGWDVSGELGGYVPGLRNRLFFFGSYNPSLLVDYKTPPEFTGSPLIQPVRVPLGLFTQLGGRPIYTRAFTQNYAAKLTWKISNSQSLESSVFGDPTSTNAAAFRTVNVQNTTGFSSQNYQTRNWVVRYNGTVSPTWLVNANFTWNHNEFTENPRNPGVFNVVDRSTKGLSPTLQGLGFIEGHNAENFAYSFDTSKVVRRLGQHTLSAGFGQSFLNYNNLKGRTGGFFPVPDLGARNSAVYGCSGPTGDPTCPLGFLMDAQFSLIARTLTPGSTQCTTCPLYTTLGGATVPVALAISRAEFGPPLAATEGLAYAAWVNDNWVVNKHFSFSLGLRWEEYRMAGVSSHYTFTDNWAPRLGVVYDPWGDRKTKLYLNWARYNYQMPLDAAIRSLSSEFDLTGLRFAPASAGGHVLVNPDGSINVVTDAAHVLNATGAGRGAGAGATASVQAGEGFAAGTKMQYEDEYVAGIERELGQGFILSARYIDRRLRRIVEDMSGVSPEAFLSSSPLNQIYLIGNPTSRLDLFTNVPNPLVQPQGAFCPSGNVAINDANGFPFANGLQACFPANVIGVNGQLGGSPIPDGIPDGFVDPVRKYQAVEFEANKGFSSGWLMRFNYRLAYLRGNYEGAYRNDNGQTDPSISSLFDFTTGVLNLLGDQFAIGPLNTERHHVANLFVSYTFDRFRIKGLTLGTGMHVQSGTPVSVFANHPAYGNQGEVPLGGRGVLGRTPVSGAIDLHGEYARKMSERFTLHFGADFFNVTNSMPVTLIDQNRDLSFQAPFSNTDFRTALNFQNPFYSRFAVKLTF